MGWEVVGCPWGTAGEQPPPDSVLIAEFSSVGLRRFPLGCRHGVSIPQSILGTQRCFCWAVRASLLVVCGAVSPSLRCITLFFQCMERAAPCPGTRGWGPSGWEMHRAWEVSVIPGAEQGASGSSLRGRSSGKVKYWAVCLPVSPRGPRCAAGGAGIFPWSQTESGSLSVCRERLSGQRTELICFSVCH